MRTFIISASIICLGLALACSDDGPSGTDSGVIERYGEACAKDADCSTGVCEEKVCTKTCKSQSDCPSVAKQHFDCGKVTSGKTVCYPRKYKDIQGKSCAVKDTCAKDQLCVGIEGSAERYCANTCKADMDCPPRYRCGSYQVGNKAAPAKRYCLLRKFCHPCDLDDQCEVGNKCLKDKNGAGFCSKSCAPMGKTADGGPTGTCPSSAKCEKVDGKHWCVHKAGTCFGTFKNDGGQCAPCIYHTWSGSSSKADGVLTMAEGGQCKKGGYCVLYDRYKGESACLMPCDSSDKCPNADEMCFKFTTTLGGSFCMRWTTVIYSGTEYKTKGPCWK